MTTKTESSFTYSTRIINPVNNKTKLFEEQKSSNYIFAGKMTRPATALEFGTSQIEKHIGPASTRQPQTKELVLDYEILETRPDGTVYHDHIRMTIGEYDSYVQKLSKMNDILLDAQAKVKNLLADYVDPRKVILDPTRPVETETEKKEKAVKVTETLDDMF